MIRRRTSSATRLRFFTTLTFLPAVVLLACSSSSTPASGGSDASTPSLDAGPPPVSKDARASALAAAAAQWDALKRPDGSRDRGAMIGWLQAQSVFEAAGESPDKTVWARFTDGRLVTFLNIVVDANDGVNASEPAMFPAATHNVPLGRTAVLLEGMDCHKGMSSAPKIAAMLNAHDYKAEVQPATVGAFRGVKGAAVFYLSTHGGQGKLRDEQPIDVLWTTEEFTNAADDAYERDLENHLLAYIVAEEEPGRIYGCKSATHYGITGSFALSSWTFTQDSFVMFSVCNGKSMGFDVITASTGASMFAGWNDEVGIRFGGASAAYAFDRFLGDGSVPPTFAHPQRPWPWEAVRDGLARQNLNLFRDGAHSAALSFTLARDDFGGLRPSVAYFDINEFEGKIYITGSFGADPRPDGDASIGGTPLAVQTWGDGKIIAAIPSSISGDLVVTSRGRKSNAVPLTSWRLDTHFEYAGAGTQLETMDCHLGFRGDVHRHRNAADDDPSLGQAALPIGATLDSTCLVGATGNDGQATPTSWSVNGDPTITLTMGSGRAMRVYAYPNPVTHSLLMDLAATVTQGIAVTRAGSPPYYRPTAYAQPLFAPATSKIDVPVDDAWTIKKKNPTPSPWLPTARLGWNAAPATNAPGDRVPE